MVVDAHLFKAPSRYSPRFEALEKKTRRLGKKFQDGKATEQERQELIRALDGVARLMNDEERRWLGSPIHKGLMKSFVVALNMLAEKNREAGHGAP